MILSPLNLIDMKYFIERKEEPKEVKQVNVVIGGNKYRLTETIDGKLEIHKSTELELEEMLIFPRVTNVINVL
tara:strand:+ start:81 stop:299 length:219 start_codon:yes stop_codon:yes gene_type:complete